MHIGYFIRAWFYNKETNQYYTKFLRPRAGTENKEFPDFYLDDHRLVQFSTEIKAREVLGRVKDSLSEDVIKFEIVEAVDRTDGQEPYATHYNVISEVVLKKLHIPM